MRYRTAALFVFLTASPPAAVAQTYTAAADLLFYGDNTEFANPFRDGETLLGISGRIFLDVAFNDAVTVRGGVFGLGRFASHEFLEHAEPMVSLRSDEGRRVSSSARSRPSLRATMSPDLTARPCTACCRRSSGKR